MFVERSGCNEPMADRTLDVRNLTVAIENIARVRGDEIRTTADAGCAAIGALGVLTGGHHHQADQGVGLADRAASSE